MIYVVVFVLLMLGAMAVGLVFPRTGRAIGFAITLLGSLSLVALLFLVAYLVQTSSGSMLGWTVAAVLAFVIARTFWHYNKPGRVTGAPRA